MAKGYENISNFIACNTLYGNKVFLHISNGLLGQIAVVITSNIFKIMQ